MVYLRKERFLVRKYNKLKLKNIGPCKIIRKLSWNAYEVNLPTGIGISPIFNIADLYLYQEPEEELPGNTTAGESPTVSWEEQMPKAEKKEVEAILDKWESKKTRHENYYQYLIKWKGQPVEDASWMTTVELHKIGIDPKELQDQFLPWESDAGASST